MSVVLRPIDGPAADGLLAAARLPIEDLGDPSISLIGAFDDRLVGVVGIQACGAEALLRSLAVDPAYRGLGIARQLCMHVFALAGARRLWLLTTHAKDYFAQLDFTVVPRDWAPESIRATAQFSSLCPSTAHVMQRDPVMK